MDMLAQQLVNGLVIGSTYAVVALGFALVFTVLRVVNFAHPEVFMVGMFAGQVMAGWSGSLWASIAFSALVAGALGSLLERTVIRALRRRDVLMTLVATLGVGIALQNAMAIVVGPDPVRFPPLVRAGFVSFLGVNLSYRQLLNGAICLTILGIVSFYVRYTTMGRATRAIAERPDVAAAFGINVNLVSQITVILASSLAGVAAVSVGVLYGSASAFVGILYGVKSFICMLVAGNRFFEGVIVVSLGLGVVEALVTAYVSSTLKDAVAFALLIGVLVVRPNGLFGSFENR